MGLTKVESECADQRGQVANAETLPKPIDTTVLRERIAEAVRANAALARRE